MPWEGWIRPEAIGDKVKVHTLDDPADHEGEEVGSSMGSNEEEPVVRVSGIECRKL